MALKFIDSQGNGSVSDAVTCIDYAVSHYASVINFSWGDPTWNSQALYDAIEAAGSAGVIFTAACGNLGENTDYYPYYPASYALANLLSVTATTRQDLLPNYSSYGPSTVSLGAPGDTIISCWNTSDSSYQYLSGTSMAAPLVAGACALLWAEYPEESYSDIIHRIMWNVTQIPALAGKCASGGRLNLEAAMQAPAPTPPPTLTVTASSPVAVIGTSNDGAFTFSLSASATSDLVVNYQLGGTAVPWDDYRCPQGDMPTSITIPAGTNSYTMLIEAIGNETGANPETVILTLSSSSSYTVGSPNSATITIYPNTPLMIQTIRFTAPGNVTLTWSSISGASYQVQSTSVPGGSWQNASGTITASGASTSWTGNVSGASQQFYRVTRTS